MDTIADNINPTCKEDFEFSPSKCHARLVNNLSKQCKNGQKTGNFCNIHYKKYLNGDIKSIYDNIDKKTANKIKLKKKHTIVFKRPSYKQDLDIYTSNLDKILKLQRLARGFIVRNNVINRGLSCYTRKNVYNDTDFLSFDSIDDISLNDYYSFKDEDGCTWMFKLSTFKELLKNSDINPYNNKKIDSDVISKFNKFIEKIERYKKIEINEIKIEDPHLKLQQRCVSIFQIMDRLKQYTQCEWFLDLNLVQLKDLYKQMEDLWNYRANLTAENKKSYVKSGKLFDIKFSIIDKITDKIKLSNILLDNFESLITEGKTISDRTTGALWVLSGLTIVSNGARDALPWLFQAASL